VGASWGLEPAPVNYMLVPPDQTSSLVCCFSCFFLPAQAQRAGAAKTNLIHQLPSLSVHSCRWRRSWWVPAGARANASQQHAGAATSIPPSCVVSDAVRLNLIKRLLPSFLSESTADGHAAGGCKLGPCPCTSQQHAGAAAAGAAGVTHS
jgi:hypothetical protein